jgi:hypothetical protein
MTAINDGSPIDSDVRISSGGVCPDFVPLRVENHQRNPLNTDASFRSDIVIERYDIRYIRSDGLSTEGVDVPYRITGTAQEVQAGASAVLNVDRPSRQAGAAAEPRGGGGAQIARCSPK